jgi:hypothetical protein
MRDISRAVVLLLLCHPLLSLSQNSAGQLPAPDQNYILNLYDAFGYQRRGTILDWGFSALVRYNGKTILFDTGNSAAGFEHNVRLHPSFPVCTGWIAAKSSSRPASLSKYPAAPAFALDLVKELPERA